MLKLSHLLTLALAGVLCPTGLAAQEPVAPTTLPMVKKLVTEAGSKKKWQGASQVTVWDSTTKEIEASGLGHTNEHKIIKVLSSKAALTLASMRFDYDPASNMVEVKLARIIRKNGKVENLSSADILDLPQPQTMIIWGPRMKIVRFGRLAVGDAIEFKLYKKGFMIAYLAAGPEKDARFIPPMRGHFYDTVTFGGSEAVMCKFYQTRLPLNKPLRYKVFNGNIAAACDYTDKHLVYSFWKHDLLPDHKEAAAVADLDRLPKVVMATTRTWEEKSRWFWKVQEDREIFANKARTDGLAGGAEEVAEMKKLVDRLCAGKSREEKIQILNHWTADNIRYMGITMGKGEGYTIHPGVMNLYDRCGVCKDKAGMLCSLLRLAGFEAYCGMTMAGSKVEDIPADQFNHCITAVREPDGSLRVLDPTWIPLSPEMWSSAESQQHYLIGTEKGETLQITPLPKAAQNRLFIDVKGYLSPTGELKASASLHGTNYADQRMRRHFYEIPQRLIHSRFTTWAWNVAPGCKVDKVRCNPDGMTDYSAPVEVGFSFTAPAYAPAGKKAIVFTPVTAKSMVSSRMAPFLSVPLTPTRKQDLLLWCNRSIKSREEIQLPVGWQVTRLPAKISMDGPAMRLSRTVKVKGSTLICETEIALKLRTIPAADYPQFKKVVQAYKGLVNDPVILKPGN